MTAVTENPAGHRAPSGFAKREATLDCPAVMERRDNQFRDSEAKEIKTVNLFRNKCQKRTKGVNLFRDRSKT